MEVTDKIDWEVVLVDNGSQDDTQAVVQRHASSLPLRYVVEQTPGLAYARNRGVDEAHGRYLIWTDDDVIVDSLWLSSYADAFGRFPDAVLFGGNIEPVLQPPTPSWFANNLPMLAGLVAARNFGPEQTPLSVTGNILPYGANYAVRAAEQRSHLYNSDLGVSPWARRLGEETQVFVSILNAGHTGYGVPRSIVRHIIQPGRQTKKYVVQYNKAVGETWAYLSDTHTENFLGAPIPETSKRFMGAPRWIWRKAASHGILATALGVFTASDRWLWHLSRYGYYTGAIRYWLRKTPSKAA